MSAASRRAARRVGASSVRRNPGHEVDIHAAALYQPCKGRLSRLQRSYRDLGQPLYESVKAYIQRIAFEYLDKGRTYRNQSPVALKHIRVQFPQLPNCSDDQHAKAILRRYLRSINRRFKRKENIRRRIQTEAKSAHPQLDSDAAMLPDHNRCDSSTLVSSSPSLLVQSSQQQPADQLSDAAVQAGLGTAGSFSSLPAAPPFLNAGTRYSAYLSRGNIDPALLEVPASPPYSPNSPLASAFEHPAWVPECAGYDYWSETPVYLAISRGRTLWVQPDTSRLDNLVSAEAASRGGATPCEDGDSPFLKVRLTVEFDNAVEDVTALVHHALPNNVDLVLGLRWGQLQGKTARVAEKTHAHARRRLKFDPSPSLQVDKELDAQNVRYWRS
ncbi:hypothetical protein AURDEDRAFT_174637 [Auricularia subglabra TFB-10046 SS5]|uniref:Uncharacterized protein n=1 Tax=Auricularia subglabra (strain TFB-10046 / SS5) TaxID=717982 RepID=J0WSS0_AURST|nr:hypothetical protein AURDEDRAFT_174637 [Auricularia subglabra TFB-10046 SS5]